MKKGLLRERLVLSSKIIKSIRWNNRNKTTTHPTVALSKGREAMIIGERWLQNGETTYGGGSYDWEYGGNEGSFRYIDNIHCLLVVAGPRTKPFWVDINSAALLDGTPVKEVW